jgi:predicted PurR-regulated permease PerM
MENQNEQPIMDSEEIDNVPIDTQMDDQNNEPMENQQMYDQQMIDSQMNLNENFSTEETDNLDNMLENVEQNAVAESSNKWSGMLPKIIILLICLALAYFLYTKKDMILEKVSGLMPSKKAPSASNSA